MNNLKASCLVLNFLACLDQGEFVSCLDQGELVTEKPEMNIYSSSLHSFCNLMVFAIPCFWNRLSLQVFCKKKPHNDGFAEFTA